MLLPCAQQDLVDEVRTVDDLVAWSHRQAGVSKISANRVGLVGPTVALRPVREGDFDALYQAAVAPATGFRWRFRGAVPSPQAFRESFYAGTLTQYVVSRRCDDSLQGLVTSYNALPEASHAYVAFYRTALAGESLGDMTEGLFLFVDYLFRTWPFRKLYGEVPSFNGHVLPPDDSILRIEGRLTAHAFHGGDYHDVNIIALHREAFLEFADSWWLAMEEASFDKTSTTEENGE